MSFYRDHVYPHLVDRLGDPKPIRTVRQRIIPRARGEVLELGVGSGANFIHYNPEKVSKLYALEPNQSMIRLAGRSACATSLDIEFLDVPGERIPLADRSVDTVVSTFTLCTIDGVVEAIRGIRRVLKPEGRLIFFELGVSPDSRVRRWQERWAPFHQHAFSGLRITRDMPLLLYEGGFQIEQLEQGCVAPFPKCWTYSYWGIAVPQY
jgi:ubiquinone/menaquinone biosynthesis C-methylase UbiE